MTDRIRIPDSRPAANVRSRNRKPRTKSMTILARQVANQATALAFLRVGCSQAEAARRLKVPESTMHSWAEADPLFKAEFEEAIQTGKAYIAGRLDGLKGKAVDVVEAAMAFEGDRTGAMKVRLEAATTLLKGRGELKASNEITGKDGTPLGPTTLIQVLQLAHGEPPKS